MADQPSLEALQDLDNAVQRVISRLTQADQDIQEVKALIRRYNDAHGENATHTPRLDGAVKLIEEALHNDQDLHNQLIGEINAARETAQNRPDGGG